MICRDLNLHYSHNTKVEKAYIITVTDNSKSQQYSQRCQASCDRVGMPWQTWEAYNGYNSPITVPSHVKNHAIMNILKVTDHYLTRGEVACALSHISLWSHCATIDQPIVILEHDAVMIQRFEEHSSFNSIIYLGGAEWVKHNWPILNIPPHASEGPNYHFICRAHAYSIDPTMAKNLLAHVIKHGICAPLDIMLRADLFNITHNGIFAYDDGDAALTTIENRPAEGRTTKRNDRLEY